MTVGNYRKKPVTVQAIQMPNKEWWDDYRQHADHTRDLTQLLDIVQFFGTDSDNPTDELDTGLMIRTSEGVMLAAPGDWIIKGVKGEFYPCKPDIFELTYETVMK